MIALYLDTHAAGTCLARLCRASAAAVRTLPAAWYKAAYDREVDLVPKDRPNAEARFVCQAERNWQELSLGNDRLAWRNLLLQRRQLVGPACGRCGKRQRQPHPGETPVSTVHRKLFPDEEHNTVVCAECLARRIVMIPVDEASGDFARAYAIVWKLESCKLPYVCSPVPQPAGAGTCKLYYFRKSDVEQLRHQCPSLFDTKKLCHSYVSHAFLLVTARGGAAGGRRRG